VEHRRRPAHHLHGGDLGRVQRQDVVAAGPLLGQAQAVDQDQHALVEQAADHRPHAPRAGGRYIEARVAGEQVGHGQRDALVEVVLVDHVDRQRGVDGQAIVTGGGDHQLLELVREDRQDDAVGAVAGGQPALPGLETRVDDADQVLAGRDVREAEASVGVGAGGAVEVGQVDGGRHDGRAGGVVVDVAEQVGGRSGACRGEGRGHQQGDGPRTWHGQVELEHTRSPRFR